MDQFYTHPDLAIRYVGEIAARWPESNTLFVEPSAGSGSFVRPLRALSRNVWAMDIDPKESGIQRGNFLNSRLCTGGNGGVVVIGNPPFGKNASLAVRFFNHAAPICDEIAFILPRTFRKESLQKRLDRNFHLVRDENVPPNAFIFEGRKHDVPCAWQIWVKRPCERAIPLVPNIDHLLRFTKLSSEADFAVRRVGFYAGRIVTKGLNLLSPTTHYFIQEITEGVANAMREIDWVSVSAQTSGVRSLSKSEIARKLSEVYHA